MFSIRANNSIPGVINIIPSQPNIPRYSPNINKLSIEAVAGTPARNADVEAEPIVCTAIVTSNRPIRFGTLLEKLTAILDQNLRSQKNL